MACWEGSASWPDQHKRVQQSSRIPTGAHTSPSNFLVRRGGLERPWHHAFSLEGILQRYPEIGDQPPKGSMNPLEGSISGKSKWGLPNGGLRPFSAICAQSSSIVHFCRLFGPVSKAHKMTTIVGNRGQLWTSTLSPHLLSPYLDFPDNRTQKRFYQTPKKLYRTPIWPGLQNHRVLSNLLHRIPPFSCPYSSLGHIYGIEGVVCHIFGSVCHIFCRIPLIKRDVRAIRTAIVWHILGACFLANLGVIRIVSGIAPANQTKERAKTKSSWISPIFVNSGVFLGKTSTIRIELLFRNAPAKSSWIDLSLVWFVFTWTLTVYITNRSSFRPGMSRTRIWDIVATCPSLPKKDKHSAQKGLCMGGLRSEVLSRARP